MSAQLRVLQLGEGDACALSALLLQYFGAEIYAFDAEAVPAAGSTAAVLRRCLDFGKRRVADTVEELRVSTLRGLLNEVNLVIDDRRLGYWLERDLNVMALYRESPPRAHWCSITPYGLVGAGGAWPGCEPQPTRPAAR